MIQSRGVAGQRTTLTHSAGPMKQFTESELNQIADLYREGWGTIEISRRLGRSEYSIRDVLRGDTKKARRLFGRLMNGKRPGNQLAVYR